MKSCPICKDGVLYDPYQDEDYHDYYDKKKIIYELLCQSCDFTVINKLTHFEYPFNDDPYEEEDIIIYENMDFWQKFYSFDGKEWSEDEFKHVLKLKAFL